MPDDPSSSFESFEERLGAEHRFNTTHWSVVLAAGDTRSATALAALEELCRTYWFPLYAYVRRRGNSPEEAQDLTQEFFLQLLEKDSVRRAEPARGKFRSFLLTSLKHFLCNDRERGQTQKRGGQAAILSLNDDSAEERYQLEPATTLTPDKLYDRRWAITILEHALQRIREEEVRAGRENQFDLLKPFLSNDSSGDTYKTVAPKLEMTANAVGVAVHRLRQRYGEEIRNQIAQTVTTAVELEQEMRELFVALSG